MREESERRESAFPSLLLSLVLNLNPDASGRLLLQPLGRKGIAHLSLPQSVASAAAACEARQAGKAGRERRRSITKKL